MLRTARKMILTVVVVVTVVTAVALSLARVLFPLLTEYRSDIELWIQSAMGQPVKIGGLDATWRGVYPNLLLGNVELLDKDRSASVLRFKEVRVDIDWLALLTTGRVEASKITIVGSELSVQRDAEGAVHVAGFGQSGASAEEPADFAGVQDWLLSRARLSIEQAVVRWRDDLSKRPEVLFTGIDMALSNDGERHQLLVTGTLPASLGRDIKIALDVTGNPFQTSGWEGAGYIKTAAFKADNWVWPIGDRKVEVVRGTFDTEAWLTWRDGVLVAGEGELASQGVRVQVARAQQAARAFMLQSVSGKFNWRRDANGWRADVDRFVLAVGDHAWPATRASVVVPSDTAQPIQFAASHLVIEDAMAMAMTADALPTQVASKLQERRPRGVIADSYLRWQPSNADNPFYFRGQLQNVGWAPVGKAPGVSNLAAAVVVDNQAAFAQIESRDVSVKFETLFRDPLPLRELRGWMAAQRGAEGWRLWSDELSVANSDIHGDLSFGLQFFGDKRAPEIDLVARYADGRGEHTSRYLPTGIMSAPLVEWLDRSIVGARVTQGGVIVRGPLDRFPFTQNEGRFEVRFGIENGILDFLPGWPRVENIAGEVAFNENSLSINAPRARTLNSNLANVNVSIPELNAHPALLAITGASQGSLADGLRYLRESPLKESVGVYFSDARATGPVQTALNLSIPLGKAAEHHPRIRGDVSFNNNALLLETAGVDIAAINGNLSFSEKSVSADDIKAVVLGQPARIGVTSELDSSDAMAAINIAARGRLNPSVLRQHLDLSALDLLRGDTDWEGQLTIPAHHDASRAATELKLSSSLRGAQVLLPAPLGKGAEGARPLQVLLQLPMGAGRPLRVNYDDAFNGVFELARDGAQPLRLRRGELRLYDGPASLPAREGLRVAGKLPYFDQADWLASGDSAAGNGAALSLLNEVSVSVDDALLLGRPFRALAIQAERRVTAWDVLLDGDRVNGKLSIPLNAEAPVVADLRRLELESPPDSKGPEVAPPDPRKFPAVHLTCADFIYDRHSLGVVELTLVKVPQGLRILNATADRGATHIKGTGSWLVDNGRHSSELSVKLASGNFGETMSMLGFAEAIRNGDGDVSAAVSWPGAFSQFALGRISGAVNIKVERGSLLEVNPGAGRIFGLLSVQALPRRLTLDFSDLFSKGFSFDRLIGEFNIKDGQAQTEKLIVDGPSAFVETKGTINLAQKTYDQTAKVIPNITGNLPIAIGVLATPAAGAAAWLIEKLLRKPVGKITQVTYHLTGSWENPNVQPVDRKEIDTGAPTQ